MVMSMSLDRDIVGSELVETGMGKFERDNMSEESVREVEELRKQISVFLDEFDSLMSKYRRSKKRSIYEQMRKMAQRATLSANRLVPHSKRIDISAGDRLATEWKIDMWTKLYTRMNTELNAVIQ